MSELDIQDTIQILSYAIERIGPFTSVADEQGLWFPKLTLRHAINYLLTEKFDDKPK